MRFPVCLLIFTLAATAQTQITGQPYSAERVTESSRLLADGTRITEKPTKVMEYRDSRGRTRTERGRDTTSINIFIFEPATGVQYVLNSSTRKAVRISVPESPTDRAKDAAQEQGLTWSEGSLGTQTIEGVLVRGTGTTIVFPAGYAGNDRPITETRESWMSPELGIVVLSKFSDPRFGEETTRLTNFSRAEPDPALFEIPPDYQITESPLK